MRKLLLASAALTLIAGPAFATADGAGIIVNINTRQNAQVDVNDVSVTGATNVNGAAVGTNFNVTSDTPRVGTSSATARDLADVRAAGLQVNYDTTQEVDVDIDESSFGALNADATAIGNNTTYQATNANFDPGFHQNLTGGSLLQLVGGQNDGSTSISINADTTQDADLHVDDTVVNYEGNLQAAAIGNNQRFEAGLNGTVAAASLNYDATQTAHLDIDDSAFGGNFEGSAVAVGNNTSLQAGSADLVVLTGNLNSSQTARLDVNSSSFYSNADFSATSIGANVSVHTGPVVD